jgi:hypothetical protein
LELCRNQREYDHRDQGAAGDDEPTPRSTLRRLRFLEPFGTDATSA